MMWSGCWEPVWADPWPIPSRPDPVRKPAWLAAAATGREEIMQNPGTAYRFRTARAPSQRYTSIAIVGLIHIAAIYALASGLAVRIAKQVPQVFEAQVIAPQQEKKTEPAPLPAKPDIESPKIDTVPEPLIQIDSPPASNPVQVATSDSPPAPDTAAAGLASTHTIPPYPPTARRLGHQGRVMLQLTIGTDGHVARAEIVKSSGWSELDQAAVQWVTSHWRYKPAVRGGVAVPSTAMAAVKFDLKTAH